MRLPQVVRQITVTLDKYKENRWGHRHDNNQWRTSKQRQQDRECFARVRNVLSTWTLLPRTTRMHLGGRATRATHASRELHRDRFAVKQDRGRPRTGPRGLSLSTYRNVLRSKILAIKCVHGRTQVDQRFPRTTAKACRAGIRWRQHYEEDQPHNVRGIVPLVFQALRERISAIEFGEAGRHHT